MATPNGLRDELGAAQDTVASREEEVAVEAIEVGVEEPLARLRGNRDG